MSKNDKSAVIVGAGIAGSSLAFHLANKGYQITLLDENSYKEVEIFHNKAVEISPHYMLNNPSYNSLMTKASKFSYELVRGFKFTKKDAMMKGVVKLYDLKDCEKMLGKISTFDIEKSAFEYLEPRTIKEKYYVDKKAGIYFKHGGWVSPIKLCSSLTNDRNINLIPKSKVTKINQKTSSWEIYCENSNRYFAKNLILCNSTSLNKINLFKDIDLKKNRGQINWVDRKKNLKHKEIISEKGYLIPDVNGLDIFGSTYERDNENKELSNNDYEKNLKTYFKLCGDKFEQNHGLQKGWVGWRAVTLDRNPYVGKVFADLPDKKNRPYSLDDLNYHPNLFINVGYGSRGYTLAPFVSKCLASMVDSSQSFEEESILNFLNPYRSWLKQIGLRKKMLTKYK